MAFAPFRVSLRGTDLTREVLAGLTLLAISVPLNIGYAQVAGLPPTAGLYALVVPTVVYALLASSRQVVLAPDAATAALVGSSLLAIGSGVDPVTLASAQAIVGGLLLAGAGWLRLGFLAGFLSRPILVGFIGGLVAEILVSQVAKMMGISLPPGGEFLESVAHLAESLGSTSAWSVALSAASVVVLLGGQRLAGLVPWALVVLVGGTVVTAVAHLEERGVKVLGAVPGGLPVPVAPQLSWDLWAAVLPTAVALSLITMAEGLLMGRVYAVRRRYPVRPNRDLVAFGAANVTAGLFSSFTMGSSTSRTAAMDEAGSRTQVPSLVLAGGTALLLLFGTSLVALVPSPVVAAVVAVAVRKLLGLRELSEIRRRSQREFAIALACFVGVLLLGPLSGLVVAFVLSLVNLAARASHPAVDIDSIATGPVPGGHDDVVVVRFAAPLFFANATRFVTAVGDAAQRPGVRTVVLDLGAVTDLDVTGADALHEVRSSMEERGIGIAYSRLRPDLAARLARAGLLQDVPVYPTNREAVVAESTFHREGT